MRVATRQHEVLATSLILAYEVVLPSISALLRLLVAKGISLHFSW